MKYQPEQIGYFSNEILVNTSPTIQLKNIRAQFNYNASWTKLLSFESCFLQQSLNKGFQVDWKWIVIIISKY